MNEVVNINELNERIERESLFVDTLSREVGKSSWDSGTSSTPC